MKDTIDDKKEFATVIKGLAGNFGGQVSKDDLALRFRALIEYSTEEIGKAGTWLLKNREEKFPPVPTTKEIISAIDKINGSFELKTMAGIEADKVLGKLKRYGRAAEPLFFNKTTVYLMTHRWNFVMLGDMDRKELEWFRKNFIDSFLDMGKPEISEMIETDGKGLIPVSDLKNLIGNK